MPRYREGETPNVAGDPLTQDVFIAAAIFGLLLGIGFTIVGWKAKQYWLAIWGAGLGICSVVFLIYMFS